MAADIIHVVPKDDEGEHLLEASCPCHPRHEKQDNGSVVIVHDAYDGRLGVEWANEILKK